MIEKCMEDWHKHLRGELPGGLDSLLAEDVVFYSPVVFTPQKGRDITKLYLQAASNTFTDSTSAAEETRDREPFRYAKEVMSGNVAVLEFESKVGGKYINGVDIITCNSDSKIIEFKVMIRPLQAVNMMHQMMAAMLEKLNK